MKETDFTEAIQKIVAECIPDEAIAFDLSGEEYVRQVFQFPDGDPNAIDSSRAKNLTEFEFISEAKTIIEFVGLIKGTYELYQWFVKQFDDTEKAKVEESISIRWKRELIKAGLSKEKAELVALKCSADVLEMLTKNGKA